MRSFLTSICILSALVATGNSLICERCTNLHGASCTGVSETCGASKSLCIATLKETFMESHKRQIFEKACGRKENCWNSSMTAGNFRVTVNTLCCTSDLCNNGKPKLLSVNTTLNGQTCPSCFSSMNANSCDEEETMSCRGEETECIQFDVVKRGFVTELRGCATEQMSDSRGKAAFPEKSIHVINFSKSNCSTQLQCSLFLPAAVGFLLLKLFS
ncbi:phospholipase A2 inhibitor and Ly6/PLAUR domain-containing protein [Microcaecilia unicolor]|uniref:Phospholipase A2 inhibitor and Ly6/PLAUR domain-containing protein-like n=1 Tax=Microcaecilia unicolor TaxID=1415580 RepID=A0A6P7YWU0_9AMPH|nr:phospholipase A2 inhibitor and Ly6/PLAUR domain-containing protein-like [Microcaecilia unicolor]